MPHSVNGNSPLALCRSTNTTRAGMMTSVIKNNGICSVRPLLRDSHCPCHISDLRKRSRQTWGAMPESGKPNIKLPGGVRSKIRKARGGLLNPGMPLNNNTRAFPQTRSERFLSLVLVLPTLSITTDCSLNATEWLHQPLLPLPKAPPPVPPSPTRLLPTRSASRAVPDSRTLWVRLVQLLTCARQ